MEKANYLSTEVTEKQALENVVAAARDQVRGIQSQADKEQKEARDLELRLAEAQRAEQERERAEERGKETKEKIEKVAGGNI